MYTRLSTSLDNIRPHYSVVVIGSGYGGGIAASRLARAGQQICLLERGKERQPGEFPRTKHEVAPEVQIDTREGSIGPRDALYDMRFNDQVNVLVGSGLGGTSLINANVSIRADPRVFDDERWPRALRADIATRIESGYQRAVEMLRPVPVPANITPSKTRAMEQSAAAMNAPVRRTNINVNFEQLPGDLNHVGVVQPPCNGCGDCVTGCNVGSKTNTLMSYLPDAVHHGAEIYTRVEVRRVSRKPGGGYLVHYLSHDAHGGAFEASVGADIVILSAGTLGSTEILLRSQEAGLSVSDRVGYGFTGNGDVLGFGYNCDDRINGIGAGDRATKPLTSGSPGDAVGPCITSVIDLRATDDVNNGMIIEEGSLPGPIAKLLPGPLGLAADAFGVTLPHGIGDTLRKKWRKLVSLFAGPYHGAMQNTQTYLVMTHERTAGRMELINDRVRVSWPGIGDEPVFEAVNRRLIEATNALGGTSVRNPLWTDLFKHHLLTVHPLGGCVMADSATTGVVNHKGQVFSGTTGSEVHDGLYVSDGSVIPRSLGCNPLLTISAVTERACALIAADRGWTIDYTLPSRPRLPLAQVAVARTASR